MHFSIMDRVAYRLGYRLYLGYFLGYMDHGTRSWCSVMWDDRDNAVPVKDYHLINLAPAEGAD